MELNEWKESLIEEIKGIPEDSHRVRLRGEYGKESTGFIINTTRLVLDK